MAQFDSTDESSCLISDQSYFEDDHPVKNLISQIQAMNMREMLSSAFSLDTSSVPDTEDPDVSSDSLNQPEVFSPPADISSALRAVALMHTLDLKKVQRARVPKLFVLPGFEEETPSLSPLDDQDKGSEEEEEPVEEEALNVSFQSKYIDFFPLYQDYCLQELRDEVFTLSKSLVSELTTPQEPESALRSCFIADLGSEAESPETTSPSPLPRPVRVTPCTLWQDLEEVKASGLLRSLTGRQIRHQETMFELIGSEASYLRSLGVLVNHFYASKPLKRTLEQLEHHILFSNIQRVMAASEKFLTALEMRLGENVLISQVGDVVLQHCSEFHSLYVPYVTNMRYQETLAKQLLQQNRDFAYVIRKLEADPVCQRQSLKSFLVLPFQRITRIKLILESILKLTEPDSESFSVLEKAIEAVHEIVSECDKGVQKMKQIEELVYLEMLMDFGQVKSVPLVVRSRFLVHQGPVRQLRVETTYSTRVSFISVYLHLFNDLLIISLKKGQRFTVLDHAEFPTHVHFEHLKTEVLGLPPHSFLLHLSLSHTGQPTAMILVAQTRSEKEAWTKVLSSKP